MGLRRVGEVGDRTADDGARARHTPKRGPSDSRSRGLGNRIAAGLSPTPPLDVPAAYGLRLHLHAADVALRRVRALASAPDADIGATAAGTMTIEPVDAPGEHEAERVAAEVVQAADTPVARPPGPIVARKPRAPAAIARAADVSHGPGGGPVDTAIERRIHAASRGGARLDDVVRRPLERSFGADLRGLRIHADAEADSLSRSLRARAFTIGPAIFFRGGAYQPHTTAGRRLLAHEVTHAIQQGALAAPGAPVTIQRSLTIQRDYAHLDPVGQARVDAQAAVDYENKAEEFEYKLGLKLSTCNDAETIADELLRRVRKIVEAWADATGQGRLKTYQQELAFAEGDKYYGAFTMTGPAIKKVFDHLDGVKHQPLRKRLKVVYNAVRNNNLAKWLKVAADNLADSAAAVEVFRKENPARMPTGGLDLSGAEQEHVAPGFAKASGLEDVLKGNAQLHGSVAQASAREKFLVENRPVHVAAPDMFSGLARGTPDEIAELDRFNKDRLFGKNAGVDLDQQKTLKRGEVEDLTSHEIQLLQQRRRKGDGAIGKYRKWRFKSQRKKMLLWEQGREAYTVFVNSPLEKAATEIGARLEAGVSGSASMMFTAAKNLGVGNPAELQKLRLAMLGWMLPNHDHSFYEIMAAAAVHNLEFKFDKGKPGSQYEAPENYHPLPKNGLESLLDGKFPAYFLSLAHKDEIAGEFAAEAQQDPARQNDYTLDTYRGKLKALGFEQAVAEALDERQCVELLALSRHVEVAELRAEDGASAALAKIRARNRFELAHLRESSAYRYLAHKYPLRIELWLGKLLAKHNKPALIDHELLSGAAALLLPLGADVGARKASLIDAGVPATLLENLGEHVLDDLVQLGAILESLPFDNTKRADEEPNRVTHGKLVRSELWTRLMSLNSGPAWVATMRIARRWYGDAFTRSLMYPADHAPGVQEAIARGVPDAIATTIGSQGLAELTAIADTFKGLGPEADYKVHLATLTSQYSKLKEYVDRTYGAHRFDMTVGAIALMKGLDPASNPQLKTLGHLGSALNSKGFPRVNADVAGFTAAMLRATDKTVNQRLNTAGLTMERLGYDKLGQAERTAIEQYTGSAGDGEWQKALVQAFLPDPAADDFSDGANKAILWNAKLPRIAPQIQAAVTGLHKLPAYRGPVYSGQRNDLKGRPQEAMRIFAVGTMHPQSNFLSTSKAIDSSYITRDAPGVAWVIEHVRTGRDISYLSKHFEEKEVLFAPGARLMVTHVEDRTDGARFPDGHGKVWVFFDEL